MKNTFERIQNVDNLKRQIFSEKINETTSKIKNSVDNILNNKNNFESFETNTDLTREKLLADIFWLSNEKKQKLERDYSQNLSLNDVMQHLEIYMKYNKNIDSHQTVA